MTHHQRRDFLSSDQQLFHALSEIFIGAVIKRAVANDRVRIHVDGRNVDVDEIRADSYYAVNNSFTNRSCSLHETLASVAYLKGDNATLMLPIGWPNFRHARFGGCVSRPKAASVLQYRLAESAMHAGEKLWGGRFTDDIDPQFRNLNASIGIDKRMYEEDIEGSIAYAKAIRRAGLLSEEELRAIIGGLEKVKVEWEKGQFAVCTEDEDIHTANERRLSELIGSVAKKLHTGRSRNDQVVTDTRLWLRKSIDLLTAKMRKLIEVLIRRAEGHVDVLMPGYTHLQRAQPVKWSQWLLSYAWYAKADVERLREIRERVNVSPLGSGAIAGNPFEIDRHSLADELNFSKITENSMHAVGDRDFVAEFLFWSALTAVHLSRFAEDLILYSSEEFGFVRFADEFSTGSSLMPQKRNPDCMELVRGKSGTLLGKCMGFMTTLKGIPSTYNKDLQEDKEALFSAFDTLDSMLVIFTRALDTVEINNGRCKGALSSSMLATDMAYYLVRKGIPFREAHHLIGEVVALSESVELPLDQLTLQQLQTVSREFEEDIMKIWDFNGSVEQYRVTGGTSTRALEQQIRNLRSWLKRT